MINQNITLVKLSVTVVILYICSMHWKLHFLLRNVNILLLFLASLFQCLLPGQLWLKLVEWSAHLLTWIRKLPLSSTSPEFHILLLWRINTGCTGQKRSALLWLLRRKAVLGDFKGPCGLLFCVHRLLAPKFSRNAFLWLATFYLPPLWGIPGLCVVLFVFSYSQWTLFHEIFWSLPEPMVNSCEYSSHDILDKGIHKPTTNQQYNELFPPV